MSKEQSYASLPQDEDVAEQHDKSLKLTQSWRRRFFVACALCTFEVILILVMLPPMARRPIQASLDDSVIQPYSPANGHVEYVNRWLTGDPDTPLFVGEPRKEMDDAWHELLAGTLIRVSAEELLSANNATSVAHKNGGYVAGLGISHSLHCLKRVKQYMHKDYYYPEDERGQDWDELVKHTDHCLESLRQAILCSADLSLYTLEWTPHSKYKPAVRVPQKHACVNWDALHDWMKGRAAEFDDMINPALELE